MEAVGYQSDGNVAKTVMANQLIKLRSKLLAMEDLYYDFRNDMEQALQETKYRLDKMSQMVGETQDENQ